MNLDKQELYTILIALKDYSWAKYGNEVNDELEALIAKVKEEAK